MHKALTLNEPVARTVALKRFFTRKGEGIAPSTLKEISHLRASQGNNVVSLLDVAFKRDERGLFVVCVFEYAEHDLLGVTARGVRFDREAVRSIFREVLKGVAELHGRGIFHRDLKTANILLDESRNVKIADFGMSERFWQKQANHNARLRNVLLKALPSLKLDIRKCADDEFSDLMVPAEELPQNITKMFYCEATTLLYRAPEQLMKVAEGYSYKADMWALGCILLELLFGRPFFLAAKSQEHLLGILMKLFGRAAFEAYPSALDSPIYCRHEKTWKYTAFDEYLIETGIDPVTRDLLGQMMQVDPARRAEARELLRHPFFEGVLPMAALEACVQKVSPDSGGKPRVSGSTKNVSRARPAFACRARLRGREAPARRAVQAGGHFLMIAHKWAI